MYGVHISYFFVKNTLQMLEKYGIIIIEWESIIIKKRKYAAPRHIYNKLTQLLLSNICSVLTHLGIIYTAPSRACARARRLEQLLHAAPTPVWEAKSLKHEILT